MLNKNLAAALGALTGLVGLVGMIRLASGAFSHGMAAFAWVVILSAMLPWIGYAAWRARHGHLTRRSALGVLLLDFVGCVVVWLFVLGPVVALACSPRSRLSGSATGHPAATPPRSGSFASRSCAPRIPTRPRGRRKPRRPALQTRVGLERPGTSDHGKQPHRRPIGTSLVVGPARPRPSTKIDSGPGRTTQVNQASK
jgi:hypothetical protein